MNLKGSLKILSKKDLESIHFSTLRILEDVGVRFTVPEAREVFKKNGFKVEGDIVKFKPKDIEDALKKAPSKILRKGLSSKWDVNLGDEKVYFSLEKKIIKDEATIDEVSHFQKLLDNRVKRLLSFKYDDLFEAVRTMRRPPRTEMPTVFSRCSQCGDLVLKSKLLSRKGLFICKSCLSYAYQCQNGSSYGQNESFYFWQYIKRKTKK